MKLEQGKERLSTKQGELVVKNSKLADVEMEVKLLQFRKDILQSQKKDIAEEKNLLFEEYVRKYLLWWFNDNIMWCYLATQ